MRRRWPGVTPGSSASRCTMITRSRPMNGWQHGLITSSGNRVAYGGEGETVFRAGDILRNDYVSYYHGYPGHQSRTVILGSPSADQQRPYHRMRDMYRRTIDQCRVGTKASA